MVSRFWKRLAIKFLKSLFCENKSKLVSKLSYDLGLYCLPCKEIICNLHHLKKCLKDYNGVSFFFLKISIIGGK